MTNDKMANIQNVDLTLMTDTIVCPRKTKSSVNANVTGAKPRMQPHCGDRAHTVVQNENKQNAHGDVHSHCAATEITTRPQNWL